MLRSLNRVFTRILALGVVALCGLAVIGVLVLRESRENLYTQKKADIRHVVEVTAKLLLALQKRVESGEMTEADAKAEATKMINAMRYEDHEYVFVIDYDQKMVIHPTKPERVGEDLTVAHDPAGKYYFRDFVTLAKEGKSGYVTYIFQLPQSKTEFRDKITYVAPFAPWKWIVATGVLVEDVDAMHARMTQWLMISLGIIAVILLAATFLVTRSIVVPIGRLTGSLKQLAGGQVDADVAGAGRSDEFGTIARAVVAVRETVSQNMREQMQRDLENKERAETMRRAEMHKLADGFEKAVGKVVSSVASATTQMESTAQSLTETARRTEQLSSGVASASQNAAANVETVAAAAEELSASVSEISRRVMESSQIARDARGQAAKTDARMAELSEAASKIGDVVKLITAIAEQTNLLALNATIEAARAGEAGKGFAVVATEVKGLASQTAKATDEISSHIAGMQRATQDSVVAIKEIGATIERMDDIASAISAAVEEQGAATHEIARNVSEAAQGTTHVSSNIGEVHQNASETGTASTQVLSSAQSLAKDGNLLTEEVERFLMTIRAA